MATTEKPSTPNMIYAAMNFKNNDFFWNTVLITLVQFLQKFFFPEELWELGKCLRIY